MKKPIEDDEAESKRKARNKERNIEALINSVNKSKQELVDSVVQSGYKIVKQGSKPRAP